MAMLTPGSTHTPLPDNISPILAYRLPYSGQDIPSISSTQYSLITVSDHSTVSYDLDFDHKPKGFKFWRLYPLLFEQVDCKYVSESIKLFLDTNWNEEMPPSLLWEQLKLSLEAKLYLSRLIHIEPVKHDGQNWKKLSQTWTAYSQTTNHLTCIRMQC